MTQQEQTAREIAVHTDAFEAIPQSESKQTTRLDEEPDLLKSAEDIVRAMNETAEKMERARTPKAQASRAAEIEDFKTWLRTEGILWETDHDRYSLMKTEKQLLTFATMIRDLNLDYERRQIERMYEDIELYLDRIRRMVADALPEISKRTLGRLGGSNDLQYYGNKVQELTIQIETAEKIFKAMELPERNTRS